MKLSEFRHQLSAVYAAYVSARSSTEDHDDIIHVAFDDGMYEPIPIAEVRLSVTDEGKPLLLFLSPRAADIPAFASEAPAPSLHEATANEPLKPRDFDPFDTPADGYIINPEREGEDG